MTPTRDDLIAADRLLRVTGGHAAFAA